MEGCLCRGHKHRDRGSGAGGGGVRRDEELGGVYNVNVWVRMRTMAGVVSVGRWCVSVCMCLCLRQSHINHPL